MTSVGPNHLTAEKSAQVFAIEAVSSIEYNDFRRCFTSKIVVVGKVGRSSSFCKHTASMR